MSILTRWIASYLVKMGYVRGYKDLRSGLGLSGLSVI